MAPPKQYDEGVEGSKLMDTRRIEEEEFFEFIDKQTLQGINSADVKKLQDTGPLSPLLTPRPAPTSPPPLPKGALVRTCETMAPSKQYDEGEQLQLMDADGKLISRGINSGDVKKLQDAGFYTCNGLMMHTKKSLIGIKGLSEAKKVMICEAAEKLLSQGFMTGSDLLTEKSVVRITTESQAPEDELLSGDVRIPPDSFGEFRLGKTQLAHTLCVSTQLPIHMHGGTGKVAYIDTEGAFQPERIVPIAERFGMDANYVLDNMSEEASRIPDIDDGMTLYSSSFQNFEDSTNFALAPRSRIGSIFRLRNLEGLMRTTPMKSGPPDTDSIDTALTNASSTTKDDFVKFAMVWKDRFFNNLGHESHDQDQVRLLIALAGGTIAARTLWRFWNYIRQDLAPQHANQVGQQNIMLVLCSDVLTHDRSRLYIVTFVSEHGCEIIVPMAVMRELHSNIWFGGSDSAEASVAISWLKDCSRKGVLVRNQTSFEAFGESPMNNWARIQDTDHHVIAPHMYYSNILDCALHYDQSYPGSTVAILTNSTVISHSAAERVLGLTLYKTLELAEIDKFTSCSQEDQGCADGSVREYF